MDKSDFCIIVSGAIGLVVLVGFLIYLALSNTVLYKDTLIYVEGEITDISYITYQEHPATLITIKDSSNGLHTYLINSIVNDMQEGHEYRIILKQVLSGENYKLIYYEEVI